ncbi:hypothetical protein LSUE1_G005903 [Lachnellula suecica]|uniref:Uncharacterized protein n=1 Tax=Lachnellula suecica TaxID=602035 RepID=A0A8T9BZK9_9HELO|nr:hypothetical protein LSUE1_G005903 [Lachnellula suecica]
MTAHLDNINNNVEYLREQKWKNKNRKERTASLLLADPNLYKKQFFTVQEHTGKVLLPDESDAADFRTAFLLEYLNVAGLSRDPVKLLGLIQNRALFEPNRWAAYDNLKTEYPWYYRMVTIEFSSLGMVMSGPDYGSLVDWDSDAAHRGDILGYPRAKLLLEAQETLLAFLKKMVQQLVVGLKPSSDLQPFKLGYNIIGRTEEWSTFTNQPFSPPPVFDIDSMITKAEDRLSMNETHLWLLQTDPDYLRHAIKTIVHGLPEDHPQKKKNNIVSLQIPIAIWHYWYWKYIVQACKNVKTTQTEFGGHDDAGQLVPEYEAVLRELELLLTLRVTEHREVITHTLIFRSTFHHYYNYDYGSGDEADGVDVSAAINYQGLTDTDPLFYALQTLTSPSTYQRGPTEIITRWSFLEDLLATNAKEASRLDEYLYNQYTDLAAVEELRFSVLFHQPRMPISDEKSNFYTPSQIQALGRPTINGKPIQKITSREHRQVTDDSTILALDDFVKAYDSHLTNPKRNDETRLVQFDEKIDTMKKLWACVGINRKQGLKNDSQQCFAAKDIIDDLKIISADSESQYNDWALAERQKLVDKINNKKSGGKEALTEHISSFESGPEVPVRAKRSKHIKREKEAARKAALEAELEETPDEIPEEPKELPIIPVSAENHKILLKMFSTEPSMAPLPWVKFLQAMHDAGFSATQTTGSVVVFKKAATANFNWDGRVNFHRPHPGTAIDKNILRGMGKRMARWGLPEQVFVVRDEGAGEPAEE